MFPEGLAHIQIETGKFQNGIQRSGKLLHDGAALYILLRCILLL